MHFLESRFLPEDLAGTKRGQSTICKLLFAAAEQGHGQVALLSPYRMSNLSLAPTCTRCAWGLTLGVSAIQTCSAIVRQRWDSALLNYTHSGMGPGGTHKQECKVGIHTSRNVRWGYTQAGMSVTPIPFTPARSWQHQADLIIQPQPVMQICTVFLSYSEKESDLLS